MSQRSHQTNDQTRGTHIPYVEHRGIPWNFAWHGLHSNGVSNFSVGTCPISGMFHITNTSTCWRGNVQKIVGWCRINRTCIKIIKPCICFGSVWGIHCHLYFFWECPIQTNIDQGFPIRTSIYSGFPWFSHEKSATSAPTWLGDGAAVDHPWDLQWRSGQMSHEKYMCWWVSSWEFIIMR